MSLKRAFRIILSALVVLGKGATVPSNTHFPHGPTDYDPINLTSALSAHLSSSASIQQNPAANAPRWSDYHTPAAGWLVNVASESDVAATIRICNENGLQFLAQAGGNGWAGTWTLGEGDVVINLRGLNGAEVVRDGSGDPVIEVGGGVSNEEAIAEAEREGVEIRESPTPLPEPKIRQS